METPTKPAQPGPSELTREREGEEPIQQPEFEPTPPQQEVEAVKTTREI